MAVGVIRGVSTELTEKDLVSALRAPVPVKQVRRFSVSETGKLVFDTLTAPLLGTTHLVAAYLDKPTQTIFVFGYPPKLCALSVRGCSRL